MDSPIRPRVYIRDEQVWVPPVWRENRVLLRGAGATAAREIGETLSFGTFNKMEGAPDTAFIEEAGDMWLSGLEARLAGADRLAVQVSLNGTSPRQPVVIVLTLTGAGGQEIGHSEVVPGRKARSVAVGIQISPSVHGPVRLKATLCIGEKVVDNARTVVEF